MVEFLEEGQSQGPTLTVHWEGLKDAIVLCNT